MSAENSSSIREIVLAVLGDVTGTLSHFDDTTPLVEVGVLDSMSILEFIEKLELKIGLEVPDADLVASNFESISEIVRLVERLITE